jgi:hypothetical protein
MAFRRAGEWDIKQQASGEGAEADAVDQKSGLFARIS